MARSKCRLEIDIEGFNEARRDPAVQAELHRLGEHLAAAAGGAPDFEVHDSPSPTRARVVVITATTAGRRAEAVDRALSRTIGGGSE